MSRRLDVSVNFGLFVLYAFFCNSWIFLRNEPLWYLPVLLVVILINIGLGSPYGDVEGKILKLEHHGAQSLKCFLASAAVSLISHIWLALELLPGSIFDFAMSLFVAVTLLAILFWNGIISVYVTSVQLGIKLRLIGIMCGWIPLVNVIVLCIIISRCDREVKLETNKRIINENRKNAALCQTKYPILLVHGVFFRDSKWFNYWGRIPGELIKNGATIYYGEHQSAASVADCAHELAMRIRHIAEDTGCEKVNVIAHSKGGLDTKYAICFEPGIADKIASLTTVNTPHRGCEFADYLLNKLNVKFQKKVEDIYNSTALKVGDKKPDFMAAVRDLTAEKCAEFDKTLVMPKSIYCQSIGSKLSHGSGGAFPLNFSYHLVRHFEGDNDGLVAEGSFSFGEKYTYVRPKHRRGISHSDMIDFDRQDIPGFDVREFYVKLVADLKNRGL